MKIGMKYIVGLMLAGLVIATTPAHAVWFRGQVTCTHPYQEETAWGDVWKSYFCYDLIRKGDKIVTIWAGQHINAGTVCVKEENGTLYITLKTCDGWNLQEIHVYAGFADPPKNKAGHLVPGQFPCSADLDGACQEYTFQIPTPQGAPGCDLTKLKIAVHCVVCKGGPDSAGVPLAGASIKFYDEMGFLSSTKTDVNGMYTYHTPQQGRAGFFKDTIVFVCGQTGTIYPDPNSPAVIPGADNPLFITATGAGVLYGLPFDQVAFCPNSSDPSEHYYSFTVNFNVCQTDGKSPLYKGSPGVQIQGGQGSSQVLTAPKAALRR